MDNHNSIVITPDGRNGWDISVFDSDGEVLNGYTEIEYIPLKPELKCKAFNPFGENRQ